MHHACNINYNHHHDIHITSKCNMWILYYNARSLLPKFDNLLLSVSVLRPHNIICIVKTWLSDEIDDSEIFIPEFQLFRNDRNRHGCGVLMYVSSMFYASVVLPSPHTLEILTLSVLYSNFKIYLCLFYELPSSTTAISATLFFYLDSIDVSHTKTSCKILHESYTILASWILHSLVLQNLARLMQGHQDSCIMKKILQFQLVQKL